MKKHCEVCNKVYKARASTQKYCDIICRREYDRRRYHTISSSLRNIPTGTVGAISELRVATDLLGKGYNVFRSISPSCPCDIVVLRGSQLLRIEVKTAYRGTSGKLYKASIRNSGFDILAQVLPNEIIYEPPMEDIT